MNKNLSTTYDPKSFENRIYEMWDKGGMFESNVDKNMVPYTIVMPPPNITGQLHMGHALDHTLQDVLIRWKRLQGFNALWLPGSDHASIATEVKVVNKLRESGIEKEDLGREGFLEKAWEWKEEYGSIITQQFRKLGNSCDWSKERFTMDEGCSKAVTHFFVSLYEKGYIYRGNRLVNWCPTCGTSLSDAEVEHEDRNSKYWYVKYVVVDENSGSEGEEIVVATSRPETIFADVAVAVHPDDKRYTQLVGKMVRVPLTDRTIPIIADIYPDPEKGTGAVKITPAHDPNDFEVGQRAALPSIVCMNNDATMNENAGKYEGMDRYECRKAFVGDMDVSGLLVKTEEKIIPIGECYRCNTVIEPTLSEQWFVAMKELAIPAIEAAEKEELKLVPSRFKKVYLNWLHEIRDWCISRQLWWGHRIPAWHCVDCKHITVDSEEVKKCSKCGSSNVIQDEDVLDTWFSSALWPFSTLGWPEKTPELEYFFPTNVLVTGYDIIFFWVIRMVFSSCEVMGQIPFEHVFVHGLVRDAEGRKMSKSLGNGIDPLDVIDEYGADALRFMLMTGISAGGDTRYSKDKIESSRNFANKLWNASRFVIMNLQDEDGNLLPITNAQVRSDIEQSRGNDNSLKDEDKWIISTVNESTKYITESLDKFEISLAGQRIYELIRDEYCDWYIELVKTRLWSDDEEDKATVRYVLLTVLKDILTMLHPFMPFITEEIWSYLPNANPNGAIDEIEDGTNQVAQKNNRQCDYLIKANWPFYSEQNVFEREMLLIEEAKSVIKAIRNIRAEVGAEPSKKIKIETLASEEKVKMIIQMQKHIERLANVSEVKYINTKEEASKDSISVIIDDVQIFVPQSDLVDIGAEMERLQKEKSKCESEISRVKGKLSNEGFVSKAPPKLIEEEREKQSKYENLLLKITEQLDSLKS